MKLQSTQITDTDSSRQEQESKRILSIFIQALSKQHYQLKVHSLTLGALPACVCVCVGHAWIKLHSLTSFDLTSFLPLHFKILVHIR